MAEDLKISVGVELNMDSAEISQQLSTLSNQLKQKDGLKIGLEVDEAGSLASIQSAIKSIQSNLNNDPIKLAARLDTTKTLSGMRSDIKTIQNALSKTDLQFGSAGKSGKKSGFSGANSFLDSVAGVQKLKDQFERAYKEYTKAFNDPTMRVADVRMNFDVDSQTFTGLVKYQNALGKTTAMTFELADGWDNVRIKQASVSDDLKKQEREQTKVLTTLAKAQSNLETLQSKAFNQKNPLTGAFKDQAEQVIKEYQSVIDQFAKSASLSDMDVSAINTAERTLKTRLDELRSAQYGASELRSKDVTSEVNRLGDALTVFENKAQSAGAMTQEFQVQVDQIRTALASVSDTQGLEQVRNQIDQLKASFDAYRTSVQGMANVRAAGVETGQLAQIQRLLSLGDIRNGTTSGIVALQRELDKLKESYQSVAAQLRNPNLSPEEYAQLTNELKQLDQQLTSVSNTAKIFDGSLKSNQTIEARQQQIEKLKNSVKELQDNWSAYADDPDLRNAVDSFAASLNDADVVNIGQYQKAFTTLRSEIKAAGKDAESFGTQVKDAFKQIFGIADILDIIQTIRQGIQTVIQNVKELDSAMVEFRKVTDLTAQGYEDFMDSAAERSIDIGTSMTDYINSAADFARLGFDAGDAQFMSEAANVFYNVSDEMDNVNESTDALIATMSAFDIEAQDVYSVIDKINEVSNRTSISSGGLADAITRGASAMALAGNTIDETLALIVAGNETVRDPASVGAGLKTLSLRIRGAESDLEDMGEEVDEYVKSTSKMRDSILELTGVDIMENESTFKSTYEILREISAVADELSDIDLANVMEQLFGKQRANIGASIIQNFDEAEKALSYSLDSTGSAAQEHAHWMESIEASENQAAAAMQNFSRTILESGAVKFYYDAKTGILGFLTQVVETLGTIPTLAAAAGAALNVMMSQQKGTGFQPTGQTSGGLGNMIQWVSGRNSGNSQLQKFLNAFNVQIASGATGVDAMSAAAIKTGVSLNDLSDSMKNTLTNANGVAVSMADLGVKASAASKKTSLMTTAMKGLSTVGNLVVGTLKGLAAGFAINLAFEGIEWVVGQIDAAIVTEEELKESISETTAEYENTVSELESVNSELETTQSLISGLEGRSLNLVEQEELENLREQNRQLQMRQKLLEDQAEQEANELLDQQTDLFEKKLPKYAVRKTDFTEGNIDSSLFLPRLQQYIDTIYNPEFDYNKDSFGNLHVQTPEENGWALFNNLTAYDNFASAIAELNYYKEKINDFNYDEFQTTDEADNELSKLNQTYTEKLNDFNTDYVSDLLDIRDTFNSASALTSEQQNYLNAIDDILQQYYLITDPEFWADMQFDELFSQSKDNATVDMLEDMAKRGELTADNIQNLMGDTDSELYKAMEPWVEVLSEAGFGNINDIIPLLMKELPTRFTTEAVSTQAQSVLDDFSSSLFAGSEGYSTLISAMQEQAEYGGISLDTYQSLIAISPELASCLEMTASGYRLNTDAVNEFIAAQDAANMTQALYNIQQLRDELANLDSSSPNYETEVARIQSEINQWEILANSISAATGAYQRWMTANATANGDAMYSDVSGMYEQYKTDYKRGKTGTDDFQAMVDYMLGDDWADRYESQDEAYAQAMQIFKRYYGQDTEEQGLNKFFDDLESNGFLDENDNVVEGTTIEGIAEQLGTSVDNIRAMLGLAEDYGADLEFDFEVPEGVEQWNANLETAQTRVSEIQSNLDKLQQARDSSTYADNPEALQAIDDQIAQQQALLEAYQAVVDSGGVLELPEETPLTEIQLQIEELEGNPITLTIEFAGDVDKLNALVELLGGTNGRAVVSADGLDSSTLDLLTFSGYDPSQEGLRKMIGESLGVPSTVELSNGQNLFVPNQYVSGVQESGSNLFSKLVDWNNTDSADAEARSAALEELNAAINSYIEQRDAYQAAIDEMTLDTSDSSGQSAVEQSLPSPETSSPTSEQTKTIEMDASAAPDAGNEFVEGVQEQVEDNPVYVPTGALGFLDNGEPGEIELEFNQGTIDQLVADSAQIAENIEGLELDGEIGSTLSSNATDLQTAASNLQQAYAAYQENANSSTLSSLQAGITAFVSAYSTLQSNLGNIDPVTITANTSSALASINALNGRTVTVNVRANTSGASSAISGLGHASGTRSAPGGLSLVDEKGAELIEHTRAGTYELGTDHGARMTMLEPGDIVHTASETKSILRRAADFIGGFFRNGLNNDKSLVGNAYVFGIGSTGTKKKNELKISQKKTSVTGSVSRPSSSSSSSKGSSSGSSSKKSSGSSSKSSSSSSSNAEKWLEHANDMIDWIEIRLDRLERKTEDWKNQAEEAVGFLDKNVKLDSGLASVEQQLDETSQAYDRYMQHAATINDYFRSSGLTDDIIKKIQEGTIDIGPYDDEMQEMIREYQEWYEKALDCKDALYDLREEQRELATQKLDNILDQYDWQIERLDAIVDYSESLMDLKGASGIEIVESDYDDSITATQSKIMELQNERKTLVEEFNNLVADGLIQEGSEDWYNYTGEIEDLDQSIIDTKTDLEELKTAMAEIPLTNLRYALTALEATASQMQGMMDLHEAQGSRAESTDYQQLITNGMEQIANLEAQNVELRKQQEGLDVLSERYQELQDEINSNNEAILDMKISQEEWNDAVLDIKISELQDYADELSKINDNYQRQKDLQQAIEDLERAKTQRTQRVYREGIGFVYEADQDAVQSAQENFEQVLHNELLNKIDDVIEALDDLKEDTNVYDAEGNLLGTEYVLPNIPGFEELLNSTGAANVSEEFKQQYDKALRDYLDNLIGSVAKPENITFSGDINVTEVDSAAELANAIMSDLPNEMLQRIYQK